MLGRGRSGGRGGAGLCCGLRPAFLALWAQQQNRSFRLAFFLRFMELAAGGVAKRVISWGRAGVLLGGERVLAGFAREALLRPGLT